MSSSSSKQKATRLTGIFKDYLLALDSVRDQLLEKEEDLHKIQIGFYKVNGDEIDENLAREYLMVVSKCLDQCNWQITNNNRKSIIIDGQVPIANMINNLRELAMNLDANTLETITDFWENIKYHLELFQILVDRFDSDIHNRIKLLYSSSGVQLQIGSVSGASNQVTEFLIDIDKFSKMIPEKLSKFRLLLRSCGNHLRAHLLDRSSVSDRLLNGINISQYPLLKVIPDLGHKMNQIFQICRKWLDREETFLYEMNELIRQNRMLAKEKETRIMSAREHQKDILKSIKASYLLCQNTKKKLKDISVEMKLMEEQIRETTFVQRNLTDEKIKTLSMSEFLNLSISQTRRNYGLQMKKQRMLNQVKKLESTLSEIETQIHSMKLEISSKADEKNKTYQKLQSEEKAYHDAKTDLESYSQRLHTYKEELITLKKNLATMESFKILKTSPEFIENIIGCSKPQTQIVQLAPSLKNAIDRKIGLISNKNSM